MMAEAETDRRDLDDEQERITNRRYREALAAGLSRVDARMWAESNEPTRLLRRCVEQGATPDEVRRICL